MGRGGPEKGSKIFSFFFAGDFLPRLQTPI
jgi:hypothetical protein